MGLIKTKIEEKGSFSPCIIMKQNEYEVTLVFIILNESYVDTCLLSYQTSTVKEILKNNPQTILLLGY